VLSQIPCAVHSVFISSFVSSSVHVRMRVFASRFMYTRGIVRFTRRTEIFLSFLLLLLLVIGSCHVFIQCVCSLDFDVQFSFGGGPEDLEMFGFSFFAIFVDQLSSIPFTRSLHALLLILPYDILDLTDIADIFVANSILQNIASDAS